MIRKIIKIDENQCDGCGNCIPACAEGALQIIDGKARLISDLFCDGLGACLGECPRNAINIEEREAQPYNEIEVIKTIIPKSKNVVSAHLNHLKNHGETRYFDQAMDFLTSIEYKIADLNISTDEIVESKHTNKKVTTGLTSFLENWPIQLHLISPTANYFQNADLLVTADCCGFASYDFHSRFLSGKKLIIACPKLDSNKQIYFDKLLALINDAKVKSINVLIMQVPCCSGLARLVTDAVENSINPIPVEINILSVTGDVLKTINYGIQ